MRLRSVTNIINSAVMSNATIDHLKSIFLKSVSAVQPEKLVHNSVTVRNDNLVVKRDIYTLKKPCYLVGFGKGVLGMAVAIESILNTNLREGILTVPQGILEQNHALRVSSKIRLVEGAKDNLPDENALFGAELIKNLVEELHEDDLVIVLITGGGSALLPFPKHPLTLSQKVEVIKSLARRGANIEEINCVRKHLSVLKGGGLAKYAYPAKVIALILSDVVNDPLDCIASGPTTHNLESCDAAFNIIQKYHLESQIPQAAMVLLKENHCGEDSLNYFKNVHNYIVGNNKIAATAACVEAMRLGYPTFVLSTCVEGDVHKISKLYAQLAYHITSVITRNEENCRESLKAFLSHFNISESLIEEMMVVDFSSSGVCLILAGEPTLVVVGGGRGGRNQQLALAFSVEINKFDLETDVSFLSCGTDGIDGPTDAAGAVGSSKLVKAALENNIDPCKFLRNNDCYSFYSEFDSGRNLIRIGHTGTNVMDIHILIVTPKKE